MQTWLFYCILAMLTWAMWGFLPKLATRTLDPPTALFFQQVGGTLVTLCVLAATRFRLTLEPRGVAWAILTGVFGIGGMLFYLQAVSRHHLSVVIMLTALYPVLVILLSVVLLHEKLTGLQWLGILFAVIAIALMSAPSK